MTENPFEIPQTLRDVSEQNLKQARTAYEQLTDFVTKAMDAWMGAMPSNPMTAGFKDIQDRAAAMAKQNAESAFTFAGKICNAQTFQEIVTLQTQFAQDWMQAYATQTQQLFSEEAIQKSERGAMGVSMGVMPSNHMTARFKDERAIAMAKKNGESAFALLQNIARAQNVQEILTIQTRFDQEQMQAYATQMQEL
jgi:hypothetical protein